MEGVGVYLVWPLSRAVLAASLMKAGVSKSGSPAPKRTTSIPCFCMALALAPTARVMDSEMRAVRSAKGIISPLLGEPGNGIGPIVWTQDRLGAPANDE